MTKRESIGRVISRSSLGSPEARKLRARTSVSQRALILRKASTRTRGNRRVR